MVVVTVGVLGIGGFALLGRGMGDQLAGDARGGTRGVITSGQAGLDRDPGTISTATEAGATTELIADLPEADETRVRAKAATSRESARTKREDKGFFGSIVDFAGGFVKGMGQVVPGVWRAGVEVVSFRWAGDTLDFLLPDVILDPVHKLLSAAGDLADAWLPGEGLRPGHLVDGILPGRGLLPGHVLDGMLPGHGFFGRKGFVTNRGLDVLKLASLPGRMRDASRSAQQLREHKFQATYELAAFESRTGWKRLAAADRLIQRLEDGVSMPPDETRAMLRAMRAMEDASASFLFSSYESFLRKRGAHEAADRMKDLERARDEQQNTAARYASKLLFLSSKDVRHTSPAGLAAAQALGDSKALLAAAKELRMRIPAPDASDVYADLLQAHAALVAGIADYDARIAARSHPAPIIAADGNDARVAALARSSDVLLTAQRDALRKQQKAVTSALKSLRVHSEAFDVAIVNNAGR